MLSWSFSIKATEKSTQFSSWNFEKLESCLSKTKLFQAELYQPKEYSNILEKSKTYLNAQVNSETYPLISQELETQCVSLLLYLSDKHFSEELNTLYKQIQIAESSFAEILARGNFIQGKQIYNESLLIQAELDLKKKSLLGKFSWNSEFEDFVNSLDSLHFKIQKGKELTEKAIALSLSQSEQLVASILDIDKTLTYITSTETETSSDSYQKILTYKTELNQSIEKIQSGQIKEGYLHAEKIRIQVGDLLSKVLVSKFQKDFETLQERVKKLERNFSEIVSHPEDEDFHASYIHSKDLLSAIQESLRHAQELNSLERYGEAFELLEEGFQLAALLEDDVPSLQRKQSHIRKLHSKGNNKETQKYIPKNSYIKKEKHKTVAEKQDKSQSIPKSAKIYITKPKDTLSKIAQKYYGKQTEWKRIQKANRNISNPDLIHPKQKIKIP